MSPKKREEINPLVSRLRRAIMDEELEQLRKKIHLVKWNTGKRKERFMLFSKSGSTEALKDRARKEGVLLVSVKGQRLKVKIA